MKLTRYATAALLTGSLATAQAQQRNLTKEFIRLAQDYRGVCETKYGVVREGILEKRPDGTDKFAIRLESGNERLDGRLRNENTFKLTREIYFGQEEKLKYNPLYDGYAYTFYDFNLDEIIENASGYPISSFAFRGDDVGMSGYSEKAQKEYRDVLMPKFIAALRECERR